jgi:hypothetical protein
MLLNYHSFYEQPAPKPAPAWLPPAPVKRPRRRRVSLALDGSAPGLEMYAEARVRSSAAIDAALLTIAFVAQVEADLWGEEMLIVAAAAFDVLFDDLDEDEDE